MKLTSVLVLGLAALLSGCSEQASNSDRNTGRVDASAPADGAWADATLEGSCAGMVCRGSEVCRYGRCLPDLGRCGVSSGEDAGAADPCPSDSYCDAEGYCTPYGVPLGHVRDDTCVARSLPAPLVPATQCAWDLHGINGTPVVIDLGFNPRGPDDGPPRPSVIAIVNDVAGSTYTAAGHVYVFDGTTCEQQFAITGPGTEVVSSGTAAVGDLDLDGVSEILAPQAAGGILAFRYDPATRQYVTAWRADAPNYTAGTIALIDLSGDAHPEVVYAGVVYSNDGIKLADQPTALGTIGYALPVVLADVDLDGEVELVANNLVYRFDDATGAWIREAYDMASNDVGFDAVADFGEFPGMRGDAPGHAELVHWNSRTLTIRTVGGDVVFSVTTSAPSNGGPPAIADLDGDGLPEVVVAGHAMVAFDPDCTSTPRPGGVCESGATNGMLWVQRGLHDLSGASNGVTVFDFDGDGRVEVVEADECFVRIFDGGTGGPRWSAPRASCTWREMPVVADTDGDYSAEIVVGANHVCPQACGLARGAPDPILPGFACVNDRACPDGSSCTGGLCRCTSDAECGEGNACTPPPSRDGMGNVCRSTFDPGVGLRIYGDARNRWVPSRTVWNQYAYSITHIGERGTVPSRATMRNNWQVPGLNDYRRNTQQDGGDGYAPNLTIGPAPGGCVGGTDGPVMLTAHFCNRGTGVAGAASSVQFDAIAPDGTRTALCEATADVPLLTGTCIDVTCTSTVALGLGATVEAVADANEQVQECREGDNRRLIYSPGDCLL